MNIARARKPAKKPFIINQRIEEILKALHFHRYMPALDVAHLLYSPGSLTYVRGTLSSLAGGADFKPAQYLYRFPLNMSLGGPTRIFTLGSKGRDYLANEVGLPVDWGYRPSKTRYLSYSQVQHNLLLTRLLVAAHAWAAKQPDFELVKTRICYELAKTAATLEVSREGKTEKKVIPDGWVEFERNDGKKFPILLEVDRGMEYSRKFKRHVRSRIEFIRSGAYKKMFQTDAVLIAYITTGERPEYRETRRAAMCAYTREVLSDLHMENWSSIFRITSIEYDQLFTTPLFDEPAVWYRPDSPTPVPLFTLDR
jgi:protein involved in plasmid replication-relaxation